MSIVFPLFISIIFSLNLILAAFAFFLPNAHFLYSFLFFGNIIVACLGLSLLFYNKKLKEPKTTISLPVKEESHDYFTDKWIIDYIPSVFCIKDGHGRWIIADKAYLQLLGLVDVDYQGKTNAELGKLSKSVENGLLLNKMDDEIVWKKGGPVSRIENFGKSRLNIKSVEITRIPVFDSQMKRYRLLVTGNDLSLNSIKLKTLQITSSVFKYSPDSTFIMDLDFRIMQVNPAFTQLTGYKQQEIRGKHISALNNMQNNDVFFSTIKNYIELNQQWEGEFICVNSIDESFHSKLRISTVFNKSKHSAIHYIGVINNITKEKEAEQHYLRLAHYDDLTSLPNRVMFINRLGQVLARSKRHDLHAVLLFIDLDHFKSINDTIGHQGGDELLVETSKRLQETVRADDVVARLSGDEFAILLHEHMNYEQASYTASLIANKIINQLTRSFYIQQRELFIGASIGIAIYPEDAENSQDLLKHADIAMYQAKNAGRNNYQFFQKNLILALKDRHQMESDMRKGLQHGQFRLFFQPQYNAITRELIGAEVLVRWFKSFNEMVPVYQFIPVAEETGLIVPLGQWILETACKKQKEWLLAGYPIKQVSVNISARQFSQPEFVQMVENVLQTTGLPPQHLELEITESMLMGDIKKVILQLQRLNGMGISLAIDDFGTGYSSLSYLKDFPIDILKIDQSFVRDTPANTKDCNIVCAIIEMGHSLGLKIVAEGVETEDQLEFLNRYTCDYIQGYLFSKPLPEPEMVELLKNLRQSPALSTSS